MKISQLLGENMKKVFLGGTCNNSTWRNEVIDNIFIDYFNPVVEDWDEKAQQEELLQRDVCDYLLYVITPQMAGVYSIAEVVDDSNKAPEKTIFCYTDYDGGEFSEGAKKSLNAVGKLIEKNGATWCKSLSEVVTFLNQA